MEEKGAKRHGHTRIFLIKSVFLLLEVGFGEGSSRTTKIESVVCGVVEGSYFGAKEVAV